MKPTRPAPRTRAALPGDVPGDVPGSLRDPPRPRAGHPGPPTLLPAVGPGNTAAVRSQPRREQREGGKGYPVTQREGASGEEQEEQEEAAGAARGARSCSCSSPGECGGRAEPSRDQSAGEAGRSLLGGLAGRGWAAETWLNCELLSSAASSPGCSNSRSPAAQ